MDVASACTESELLDVVVVDVLVVVGEYDVAADVAQDGACVGAYESGSSEDRCTDARNTVTRLAFVDVKRFREGGGARGLETRGNSSTQLHFYYFIII